MIRKGFEHARENKCLILKADLVVTGGGLAGVCAAIVAARENLKVVLVQDRPVLGGNASSEVRLWALGATSHMGNNNRWAREGGVINEILLDNLKRNKQGSALIFDTILLEKTYEEKNITLLLNTAVYEVHKSDDHTIKSVKGFCSQNSTAYVLEAPFFCDASGDGIVAFQAGASFRMGAEKAAEFDEGFAPN
ncbi:MAG: FAD-dependent oxidoreductase, partial [Cyclobacteriaceae bacterium]|nr:FAD-dependent oxidoreductase [Cyclobacteriaceae bacterium]